MLRSDHTKLIIVRGAGDIATGTLEALFRAGFPVMALEIADPSAIRRKAAFCEAVFDGETTVEGIRCRKVPDAKEAWEALEDGILPLLIDPEGETIKSEKPMAVVDAILAKKNLGTTIDMAPITVALGPGFSAGEDVKAVIETSRGHRLGRIIKVGPAAPNTGIPGLIEGYGKERVMHSPASGTIRLIHDIGDLVEKGEVLAMIGETPLIASLTGVLRGIIRDGYPVFEGLKVADIDPRAEQQKNCYTISDKARCIGGSVLTSVMEQMAEQDID